MLLSRDTTANGSKMKELTMLRNRLGRSTSIAARWLWRQWLMTLNLLLMKAAANVCLFARRRLEKSRRGTVFMERLIREYECVVEPGAGLFTNRASNSMNTY